jgi:putative endonuclease
MQKKKRRNRTPRRTIRVKAAQAAELPKVQKPEACYCYIVQCSDGTFYTGWTTDPERRLKTHNAGRGARYTRTRRPVKLVYVETQPDRVSAMKRERAIKAMTREKKRGLIQNA